MAEKKGKDQTTHGDPAEFVHIMMRADVTEFVHIMMRAEILHIMMPAFVSIGKRVFLLHRQLQRGTHLSTREPRGKAETWGGKGAKFHAKVRS